MTIIIGLIIFLILLTCFARFEGKSFKEIFLSAWISGKKSFIILNIFILIGAITSSWIISGTIPTIVYLGLKFMNPEYYYISVFVITSCVSFLLGSSFGTLGTVGIVLITIGRGLNVDLNIAGGAILSGSFLGDRCSPVSSSASLVATLTETELYTNMKNMFFTGFVAFTTSCLIYLFLPKPEFTSTGDNILISEIVKYYKIGFFPLIPAIIILVCGALRVNVKLSMLFSVLSSILIAAFLQGNLISDIFKTIVLGYHFPHSGPLSEILKGGGLISMLKASIIVFISCLLSGVLDHISIFNKIKSKLEKLKTKKDLFLATVVTAFISSGIGCNQSIATVLTDNLMKKAYRNLDIPKDTFALHLENSCIVIAPLVPWNIASLIPMTIIGVTGLSYLKYSFFLYLLPLITFGILLTKKEDKEILIEETN